MHEFPAAILSDLLKTSSGRGPIIRERGTAKGYRSGSSNDTWNQSISALTAGSVVAIQSNASVSPASDSSTSTDNP